MSTILNFRDASLAVMQAVIVECSKQREGVGVNLANGPGFAPQVSCGGSKGGEMLYAITTPPLTEPAALAVMAAAVEASREGALPCGCIPHQTRMTDWGFRCDTEGQGYCNFECPHEESSAAPDLPSLSA